MATMQITFSLTVQDNFIDTEVINPQAVSTTVDGDNSRRTLATQSISGSYDRAKGCALNAMASRVKAISSGASRK